MTVNKDKPATLKKMVTGLNSSGMKNFQLYTYTGYLRKLTHQKKKKKEVQYISFSLTSLTTGLLEKCE